MTHVYFVRHAQPLHAWEDDRTRPLTDEGREDAKSVLQHLTDKSIDVCYCSPYLRSVETIAETAGFFGLDIIKDERLRERQKGNKGNNHGMFRLRWADHDFHEPGGESIRMVQSRNIEALMEILNRHPESNILIGTHGTALSSIINHFRHDFGCEDFLRIIDWMPYIVRLDFEGSQLAAIEEIHHVYKEFTGNKRADKK